MSNYFSTGFSHWFIKKRLYHPLFWVSYFLFWAAIYGSLNFDNVSINLIYLIITLGASYINLYYLMPKFLYTKRFIPYTLGLLFIVVAFSALLGLSLYQFFTWRSIDNFEFSFPEILGPTLGAVVTPMIFMMIMKLVKNLYQAESQNRELEREKLEHEIKYLKSQLNPHFLFNALNNIYFLIKKDPEKASDCLAKFSDMMRYQLYECNEDKISLQQEIAYINNYIEIIKLGKSKQTQLDINITENVNGEQISPLILLPLVENAFKHVEENTEGDHFLKIHIDLQNDTLDCNISNTRLSFTPADPASGGIGLQNIKRRLKLLYPEKHQLNITRSDNHFSSDLKLNLC